MGYVIFVIAVAVVSFVAGIFVQKKQDLI